ncbi:MAG: sodium:solute symporter [Spirochaetes bacterium]|nr:sodium:solute symporter [Spirochaetota bacterium]
MWIDIAVIALYLAFIIAVGIRASGSSSMKDYFLGNRAIPWPVACLSIVATETSALTFISFPGMAYVKGVGFLQIALGYIVGRVLVALVLLPRYFAGDMETAYHFLQRRFGVRSRQVMSVIFHVTRLFADAIRLFCTAIPVALLLGMGDNYGLAIAIVGASSLIYAYVGGIRSVAVVDSVQLFLYLLCAAVGIYTVLDIINLPLAQVMAGIPAGHLRIISTGLDGAPGGLLGSYNIFSGILGGALLSFATHGTDHLLVQRVLACKGLGPARRAMIGSGILVFFQFALFLFLGLLLRALFQAREFTVPDQIMPHFIVHYLPHGLRGLMVAGIFAVAMSTLSSTINSLSSSTAYDLLGLGEREMPEKRKVLLSRLISLGWAAAMVAVAMMFRDSRSPLVEITLGIASITSGGMLGIFLLGALTERFSEGAALTGVIVSVATVAAVTVLNVLGVISIFWPWFVPIGFTVSIAVSLAADGAYRLAARGGA